MAHRLEILGQPRIVPLEGTPEASLALGKPLALLSYLVLEEREVSRDELGRLFWPDSSPSRARQSVRQALWLIRRTLGDEVLSGEDPVSAHPAFESDVLDFQMALSEADADRARKLWRGRLLSRLVLSGCREWDRWLEEKREGLRERFFQSLMDAGVLFRAEGKIDEARAFLEEALTLGPFSLPARITHIEVLLDLNRVGPARDALVEARREVGDQPGAEERLGALEERIQRLLASEDEDGPEPMGLGLEFVGRSGELSELKTIWRRVTAGRSRLATIEGPTGIGKSRLANEFLKHVEAEGGLVARIRGFKGEQKIERGMVADLAQALMGLPGAAGVSGASEAVLRSILPSLSPNGSQPELIADASPAALANAITDLLEAVAFEAPLVVFVDDLQWVDDESLALLVRLTRRVEGVPCLFLLATRISGPSAVSPTAVEEFLPLPDSRRIPVEPLSESATGELLTLLAEVVPPESVSTVVRRIYRASSGNPLFIVELLRKLIDEGVCRFEGEGWILDSRGVPAELDLPESLQGLIRERLERLSGPALQVVRTLAREVRGVGASELRRKSALEEAVFTRAIGELLSREVLDWVGEDSLDFAHDQLRDAAVQSVAPGASARGFPNAMGSPWRRVAVALVLILATIGGWQLTVGLATAPGENGESDPGESPGPTYPYGEGVILGLFDPPLEIVPPARAGEEWVVRESEILVPEWEDSYVRGPFRTPGGDLRWFGYHRDLEDPPVAVEVFAEGSWTVLHAAPGDVGFYSLAPDGRWATLMEERTGEEHYAQNILVMDLETRESWVLYEGAELVQSSTWSPDGQRITAVARGRADTLLVLTPAGGVIARQVTPDLSSILIPTWCPDSRHLVFSMRGDEGSVGVLFDTESGSTRFFGESFWAVYSPVCLGNSPELVYIGLDSVDAKLVRENLETAAIATISDRPLPSGGTLRWVPARTQTPIRRIRVAGGDSLLTWGERRRLDVRGIRTDGGEEPVSVRWSSLQPGVVSVSPGGLATANGVGGASVVAEFEGWLRDTLRMTVVMGEERRQDVLFRETYTDPDLALWDMESAFPQPEVVVVDGGPALSLEGDGRYADEVYSRGGFSLMQGATLELEFRLRLTGRRDHQRMRACLVEGETDPAGSGGLGSSGQTFLCFVVPGQILTKYQADRALFLVRDNRYFHQVDVGRWFPSEDWVHVALQVRADGAPSLFLNREHVISSQFKLPISEKDSWRVMLAGASVDTELLVRNLVVWRGERFDAEEASPIR